MSAAIESKQQSLREYLLERIATNRNGRKKDESYIGQNVYDARLWELEQALAKLDEAIKLIEGNAYGCPYKIGKVAYADAVEILRGKQE